MGHITIEDVAVRAGVSPTTVSHVFSGHRPVSEETKQLVARVAQELGYRPNAVAKSLRMQRTSTAMIVLPDITNPFYPVFARGVQDVLRAGDYHVLMCNTDSRESEERAFLDEALARRLDGLIFMGYWVSPVELLAIADAGLSVVNLGQVTPAGPIDAVWSGDLVASAQATSYLLTKYGDRVAFIDGTHQAPVAQSRSAGYRDAHVRAGLHVRPGYEIHETFDAEGGRRGMARLLAEPSPPRAVLCVNDLVALGALEEAQSRGADVPGDIAIVGYDDIESARLVSPALTTVRNFPQELGVACGNLLLSRMSGEYTGPGREVLIQAQLVVRDSA